MPLSFPQPSPLELPRSPSLVGAFLARPWGGGIACRILLVLAASVILAGGARAQQQCVIRQAANVSFDAICQAPPALDCSFVLSSPAPPSGIRSLEWDFGDGDFLLVTAPGPNPSPVPKTYGAAGTYPVTLRMTDGNGDVSQVTSAVSVGGQASLALDDAFATPNNTAITITADELLANDAPGVVFIGATHSCFVGNVCTYTPNPNSTAPVVFSYSVRAQNGVTSQATVTINVSQAVVARTDLLSTYCGVPLEVFASQLLQNDTPSNVSFIGAENPSHGTLSYLGSTEQGPHYRFTPDAQFVGTGTFEYLISLDLAPPYTRGFASVSVVETDPHADFSVQCTVRTCTVNTRSKNCSGVLRYFWDWGDGTPPFEVTSPYPWADQTHTYPHSRRYTITHTVVDSAGRSDSMQVDVVPNTPPVAVNDVAETDRDVPKAVPVLANDTDADCDVQHRTPEDCNHRIASVDLSAYPGSFYQLIPDGELWDLKVTPPDGFVGTMTIPYTMMDPAGGLSSATLVLTVNQWTVVLDAQGEQLSLPNWTHSLPIPVSTLLANDYADLQPRSIVGYDTSLLTGTLSCTGTPTICTFTAPGGSSGVTMFRYTISDPAGHRDTATVRIYVSGTGTPPTLHDDYFTTARGTPKTFTIQDIVQNDVDPDGDTLTVLLANGAKGYGSVTCSAPMYKCTYTPNTGFVGTDHFPYTAGDGINNPAATAYVNVDTLPPATATFDAREDMLQTGLGAQRYLPLTALTANDFDPEHDPITVSSVNTMGVTGLTCDSAGCLYRPPGGYTGTTKFSYTATDGHGSSDTAFVKIRVGGTDPSGTNNPPVPTPDTLTTPKNTVLRFSIFDLLRNDYDPDNDPLNVALYVGTAHKGSLACGNPNYWCTYTPNAGVTGTDTITYAVSDANIVTSTVSIVITP